MHVSLLVLFIYATILKREVTYEKALKKFFIHSYMYLNCLYWWYVLYE